MMYEKTYLRAVSGVLLGSVLLAILSIVLGNYVDYLAYLPLFNAMAFAMLSLAVVGLALSLFMTWKGKSPKAFYWLTNVFAVLLLCFFILD